MVLVPAGKQLLDIEKVLGQHVGITSNMKVADLGCGNGYNTIAAAKLVGGKGQVYAVDILKTALATVDQEARRHNLNNIKTIWSDLEILGATQIPEQSIDVALVVHTLFQVKNIPDFIQETLRIVKPSGAIAVIDWHKNDLAVGPPPNHRISEEEVKDAIGQVSGIKLAEEFNPGQYHYGLIYKKLQA
ncbi:MAG: class I SAM-dependent methyltransferase [Patescibacteria group bacterium]